MSSQNVNLFFKFLTENPEYEARAKSLDGGDDAMAAYARELGYDVSPEELRAAKDKALKILKSRAQKAQQGGAALSPASEALRALMKLAEENDAVAKRLEELGAGAPEELIAYGKEMGYEFDIEALKEYGKEILEPTDELSDEELEQAAGGLILVFLAIGALVGTVLGVGAGVAAVGVSVGVAAAVSEAF